VEALCVLEEEVKVVEGRRGFRRVEVVAVVLAD